MSEELRSELEALRRQMRRETRLTRLGGLAVLVSAVVLVPLALRAAAVGSMATFTNGTVADAAQINGNFGALTTAVNDNDTRIGSLESGRVRGITTFKDCTRLVIANAVSFNLAQFTVNKKSATSKLLIQGVLAGKNDASGSMQQEWIYGTTTAAAQGVMYDENGHGKVFPTAAVIEGHTTTGSQTLTFRYRSHDGGTGQKPYTVHNPNSTDDSRLQQTCSVYWVTEVEP